jgi:magnesium transporter
MLYLSQLLGALVEDLQGARIGKLIDITVPAAQIGRPGALYPSALLVEGQEEHPWRVPRDAAEWHEDILRLRIPLEQLALQPEEEPARAAGEANASTFGQAARQESEVSLAHDVLDKQVIDVERKKAVRVNDICLANDWQIVGIDNSTLGLVRRLAPNWLLGAKSRPTPTNLIAWEHIEVIGVQQREENAAAETPSQVLRPSSGQLAELHPADIAEIVHQLTPGQGARLIEGLDDETAADTMEEIDTERQRHILENIQAERAADILQAMGPDEAADLLAQLPEESAQELLRLMTPKESEDVQELLEYEEDSAGGLMTTDYIALNATKSAAEALEAVRQNLREQDVHAAYVYCVADESADERPLLGVVSLWDLLIAEPSQALQELMETDVITVRPETDPRSVAQIMAKYNLLAVPVVNDEGMIEGVVTVDDALDILLPADHRRKPTRMY